jgi:predicted lysophospholipase L1 biosynthesis ABC-type transport system permease subunit
VREGVRRNLAVLAAIAVVLALGLGSGLAGTEIADRTERAYPDYLRRAAVGDLVVNPSLDTTDAEEMMRTLPGVTSVASDSLLTVAVNDDESDNYLSARVSADGRYTTQDRPVVHEGRMIRSGAEAFLSRETAADFGVAVGDRIKVAFYTPQYTTGDGEVSEVIALGTDEATVVGTGVFADEVLPDELYPRQRLLLTPDIASKYDCVKNTPDPDDPRPLAELFPAIVHADCSTSYRYFSLRVEGGPEAAKALAGELTQRFGAANERLPAAFRENSIGYEVIASFTADDVERVRQSLSPVVTALRVFGLTAAFVTVGVALLLVVRVLRRRERDVAVWHSLGLPLRHRAAAVALPVAGAALVGIAGALVVTWLASSIGPVASARAVVPHRARSVSSTIVVPLLAAMAVFAIGLALAARRCAGRPSVVEDPPSARRVFDGLNRWPSLSLGVRAATHSRGAGALLGGSVLAVAAVSATAVFSASVVHFVDTPALFGWSYDTGVLVNAGYGPTNLEAVRASLDRAEVERWGIAAMTGGLTVNGTSLPFVGPRDGFEDLIAPSTIVTGRSPRGADEIALGSRTARDLGVDVGDEVTVQSPNGERSARVSGLVVLPAIGPFESDRASLGNGVLLSIAFFDSLLDQARAQTGRSGAELADQFASFVAIDFAEGVDPDAFMAEIAAQTPKWDPYEVPPPVFTDPVRPATVVDVAAMRQVPILLASAFAVTMAASVVAGIASGTRARRRELAVVRALGGTPRQIRASIRWHAFSVVATGLVAGLPIGVVVGRLTFGGFARDLGVAPRPYVPLVLPLVIVVVVLALGLVASMVPARRAVRRRDAVDVLRAYRVEARLA